MKSILKSAGIIAGSLLVIWIAGRLLGFWAWYKVSTPANEPAMMIGEQFFATNFKKPHTGNFIVYVNQHRDTFMYAGGIDTKGQTFIHRLCGMPGEVLEMKNGVLYINGKNFDAALDLKMEFLVTKDDINRLDEADFNIEKGEIRHFLQSDTITVMMDKTLRKKYSKLIKLQPWFPPADKSAQAPFVWYDKNKGWTVDNFGPLQIPEGSCFVMGDNRHNSLDSRYTGFVAVKDISGVVINR